MDKQFLTLFYINNISVLFKMTRNLVFKLADSRCYSSVSFAAAFCHMFSVNNSVFVTDSQEEEDEGLGVDLSFIGSHAFARMEGDIDKQRKLILQGQLSEAALQKQHQRK